MECSCCCRRELPHWRKKELSLGSCSQREQIQVRPLVSQSPYCRDSEGPASQAETWTALFQPPHLKKKKEKKKIP